MGRNIIRKCLCDHDDQDQMHGYGMRVMNPTGKGEKDGTYRCTVCGRESSGEKPKEKPKDKKK